MTVETFGFISQLSPTYPAAGDVKSEGDDHIRGIKSTLQTQFPNLGAAAVTPTATELNYVDGVTSAIQTQIDNLTTLKAPLASPTLTGTPLAPTATTTDSSTQIATTALVSAKITAAALSISVPVVPGDAGKYLTNNGSISSWGAIAATGLSLLATVTPGVVSTLDVTGLTASKRITIIGSGVTLSGADTVQVKLSVNNGSTFPGTVLSISASAATPTPCFCDVLNASINATKRVITLNSGASAVNAESDATVNAGSINAVRIFTLGGANFTAGIFQIWGDL